MEQPEISHKLELISNELTQILPDFKLLEAGVPLFDSNYKYFSHIFLELRDFIQKEVTKSLEPLKIDLHKQADSLENEKKINKSKFKEDEMAIESLKGRVENLAHDTNSTIRAIDKINDRLENFNEEVLGRVTYTEFNALGFTVETKANRSALEESERFLTEEIQKKVNFTEFERLCKTVEKVIEDIQLQASKTQLEETEASINLHIEQRLENFLTLENFHFFKEDSKFESERLNEKIERTETIQGFTNDAIRKELAQLDKAVKKRPWRKDIEIFRLNLQEAAKIIELQRHKEKIIENLDNFKQIIDKFGNRCDNYEKILARFDEILLDKAAKDDISQIQQVIPTFAKKTQLDQSLKEMIGNFDFLNEKVDETLEKLAKTEVLIGQVNNSFRNFKNDNKDNIQMKNSILDLQGLMESKAEKVDFLSISESVVKKEEFLGVKNGFELVKRQLEMQVAIIHAVMRTMVKSNDSATVKNKQRLELLRNMGNLMNWMGVVGNLESSSILPTMNSGLLQKSNIEIDQLLPNIRQPRKASLGDMDFPRFKGRYEV
jgi:hypothetical protein